MEPTEPVPLWLIGLAVFLAAALVVSVWKLCDSLARPKAD